MLGNQCAYVNLWIPGVVSDKPRREALDPVETLCILAVNLKSLPVLMRKELTNCSAVLHRPPSFCHSFSDEPGLCMSSYIVP